MAASLQTCQSRWQLFWYKHMSFCIIGSCSLLPLSPVLPTPGFIMLASILGHIQVLCGSCAGAYSIGRSASLRQRALLHLRVLCVIPSRRSLLYTSLLVQVSHSFLPEIYLVNFSIGTWIPRICTDFVGNFKRGISKVRSLPSFPSVHRIV